MILLLLAAQAAAQPGADGPRSWDNPPTELVDFLGRRRLCAELGASEGRDVGERQEAERLHCAALPAEERIWRAHYAGNAPVLRWIDRDPRGFHLNGIMVRMWDGPPTARPQHIVQRGRDQRGRRFRLVINSRFRGGRLTLVTVRYGDWPVRSFALDNDRFPLIDLLSLGLAAGEPPGDGRFYVLLRFGHRRGYCQVSGQDDRSAIDLVFQRDGVDAHYLDRTNCDLTFVTIPDAPAR